MYIAYNVLYDLIVLGGVLYDRGGNHKNLRIKNGYTQTELAKMLGLILSTMQKYENGAIRN